MVHPFWQVVAALIPSAGVGLIFWFALRAIITADRTERLALARLDTQESTSATAPGDDSR